MKPATLLAGGAAVVVSLGVAVVLYQRYGTGDVGYGVRTYAVESDSRVRVQFEVDMTPGRTAVCVVRARDAAGAEVGSELVPVGPTGTRSVVVTHELPTTARASTGEVTACSLR